jgi:hypothetical protein
MNNNNNTLFLIGGALLALAGASFALFKFAKKTQNTSSSNLENLTTEESEKIAGLNYNLLLKKGNNNNEVRELQRILVLRGNNLGISGPDKNGVDGFFGLQTEAALLATKGTVTTTLNKFLNYD